METIRDSLGAYGRRGRGLVLWSFFLLGTMTGSLGIAKEEGLVVAPPPKVAIVPFGVGDTWSAPEGRYFALAPVHESGAKRGLQIRLGPFGKVRREEERVFSLIYGTLLVERPQGNGERLVLRTPNCLVKLPPGGTQRAVAVVQVFRNTLERDGGKARRAPDVANPSQMNVFADLNLRVVALRGSWQVTCSGREEGLEVPLRPGEFLSLEERHPQVLPQRAPAPAPLVKALYEELGLH